MMDDGVWLVRQDGMSESESEGQGKLRGPEMFSF